MKKAIKKITATVLCVIIMLGIAPLNGFVGLRFPKLHLPDFRSVFETKASAASNSGKCGNNMNWEYDEESATLTISGSGDMYDYYISSSYGDTTITTAPWSYLSKTAKTVVVDGAIKSIGKAAFYNFVEITGLTINVHAAVSVSTVIDPSAFRNCSKLVNVVFPNSLTSIGEYAFEGCSSLTEITIPKNTLSADNFRKTTLNQNAFKDCINLTSITLSETVTNIVDGAFTNCNISTINVSENNTVFRVDGNCLITGTRLKLGSNSSVIPQDGSVVFIGDYAFSGLRSLTSVSIPDSVTSIGPNSFSDCYGLNDLTVSEGNTVYHSSGNCLIETASNTLISGCNNSVIPSNGSVTSINPYAFSGCIGLTNTIIPDSVTSIGEYAFSNCISLSSVIISGSVENICPYTFENCTGLTELTISDGVTTIDEYAFNNCSSLEELVVPDSVTSIEVGAFKGCTGLVDITLPFVGNTRDATDYKAVFGYIFGFAKTRESQQTSDNYNELLEDPYFVIYPGETKPVNAVWEFTHRENVYFNNNIYFTFTSYYYYIPSSIRRVSITDGNNLEPAAFMNCTNLTEINLNEGIPEISKCAFRMDVSLTSVSIPDSVISIGDYAFSHCSAIALTNADFNDNIEYIGDLAFEYCGIESFRIGPLATVGSEVFYYSDIKEIWISKYAAINAISYCPQLETIIYEEGTRYPCSVERCNSLYSIEFPESSVEFPYLRWNDNLNQITLLGDRIPEIPYGRLEGTAFIYNSQNWQNGVLYLDRYLIKSNMKRMNSFTMKENLISISGGSLFGCSETTTLIPDSVEYIGSGALGWSKWLDQNCGAAIENLYLGKNLRVISANAFSNQTKIKKVYMQKKVTFIGAEAIPADVENKIDLYYYGSPSDWEQVTNNCVALKNARIHFWYRPDVSSVEILKMPDKTEYWTQETPDLTGMKIKINYNDGTYKIVSNDLDKTIYQYVYGEDPIPLANETDDEYIQRSISLKVVSYVSFQVTVRAIRPTNLEIVSMPRQLDYELEDEIDLTGLKLKINYNNGTSKTAINGFNCDTRYLNHIGQQKVTVTFEGLSVSFYINVEVGSSHEHFFDETETQPTCESPGSIVYQCICGYSYSEEIPALGHSFSEWTVQGDGTKTRTCEHCDKVETKIIYTGGGKTITLDKLIDYIFYRIFKSIFALFNQEYYGKYDWDSKALV